MANYTEIHYPSCFKMVERSVNIYSNNMLVKYPPSTTHRPQHNKQCVGSTAEAKVCLIDQLEHATVVVKYFLPIDIYE